MLAIFGTINNPFSAFGSPYGEINSATGLTFFISNIIKLVMVGAGLFAFINLLIAGIGYISSGGDVKLTQAAWARINMSLIGLVIIVGAFSIAAIIGLILYGNPLAILQPTIYGPGQP